MNLNPTLLSYRDPQFWKNFRANHWEPRVPTVIRQPFKTFPFSNEALHRALCTFEQKIRGGDLRTPCLVSVGDKEVRPLRPLKQVFAHPGENMDELEATITRVFKRKRFGLMVTHFQAAHPEIWEGIVSFIQDARGCIDYPVPRAFLDLFYGNYLSHFTGVHKDTQEIFAFVVRGKKRMLAWPFEYFLSRVPGLSAGDRYFHKRLEIDYRKYRKDALVLEAQAGDVFYWTSDLWHVAEPVDGNYSAMISLGLFRPELAVTGSVQSDSAPKLRWETGFGFELGGPTQMAKLSRVGKIQKEPSTLLRWTISTAPRMVTLAANGHSVKVAYSAALIQWLGALAQGEWVPATFSPPERGSTVWETGWNKKVELKTRKRVSRRDPRAALAEWLLKIHAVKPV